MHSVPRVANVRCEKDTVVWESVITWRWGQPQAQETQKRETYWTEADYREVPVEGRAISGNLKQEESQAIQRHQRH